MDQRDVQFEAGIGHDARRLGIDDEGEFALLFGLVDGGVGGGIDHQRRSLAQDGFAQGFRARQVECFTVEAEQFMFAQSHLQFAGDLSGVAADQDLHANVSASVRLRPCWSLVESCGLRPSSGQSMASCGSSQRMQRS
jgi:hypothetical protein